MTYANGNATYWKRDTPKESAPNPFLTPSPGAVLVEVMRSTVTSVRPSEGDTGIAGGEGHPAVWAPHRRPARNLAPTLGVCATGTAGQRPSGREWMRPSWTRAAVRGGAGSGRSAGRSTTTRP